MLVVPRIINRDFIRRHTNWIFVYGCDIYNIGQAGQPYECEGELNCYGVPTLIKWCASGITPFDDGFKGLYGDLDEALKKIPRNNCPIVVLRKIGQGCSRMQELAPKLYMYMKLELAKIETSYTINWDAT